jgi:hypothetical protein
MCCWQSVKSDCGGTIPFRRSKRMSTGFPPIGGPGTSRRRRRRLWYAIGAALIVIGVIASITLFVCRSPSPHGARALIVTGVRRSRSAR